MNAFCTLKMVIYNGQYKSWNHVALPLFPWQRIDSPSEFDFERELVRYVILGVSQLEGTEEADKDLLVFFVVEELQLHLFHT